MKRQESNIVTVARTTASRRLAVDVASVTAFAALTAVGARVQVHLPFTPVPVTGQVFCVLLAGAVLGARLGFVSQVQYLAAGAAGLPVFAHGGGPLALLGPTSGYLVGFPVAAAVVGALAGRLLVRGGTMVACLCGVGVIYVFGLAWYAVWTAALGHPVALVAVLAQSVAPFVLLDVLKATLAAAATPWLRQRFSGMS